MQAITTRNLVIAFGAMLFAANLVVAASVVPHLDNRQQQGYLRLAHGAMDVPAVDVQIDNDTVLTNVSSGTVSEYLHLDAGTYNLTLVETGDSDQIVLKEMITIEPRRVTTLAVSGGRDTAENVSAVEMLEDAVAPANNESAIRFVHLAAKLPTVDITTDNGSTVLAENVSFGDVSEYLTVEAGNLTVELRAASATGDEAVIASITVVTQSASAHSVLVTEALESPGNESTVSTIVSEDATITIELPSNRSDS